MARLGTGAQIRDQMYNVRRAYETAFATATLFKRSLPAEEQAGEHGALPPGLPETGQVVEALGPVITDVVKANVRACKIMGLVENKQAAENLKIPEALVREFATHMNNITGHVEAAHAALTSLNNLQLWPGAKLCAMCLLSVVPLNPDPVLIDKARFIVTRRMPAWDVFTVRLLESVSRNDASADHLEPHVNALFGELFAFDARVAAGEPVKPIASPLSFECARAACIRRNRAITRVVEPVKQRKGRGKAAAAAAAVDQHPAEEVKVDLAAALRNDKATRGSHAWFWNPGRPVDGTRALEKRILARKNVFKAATKEFVREYGSINVLQAAANLKTEPKKGKAIPSTALTGDLINAYTEIISAAFKHGIDAYTETPDANIGAYYEAWEILGKVLHRTVTRPPLSTMFDSIDTSAVNFVRTVLRYATPSANASFAGDFSGIRLVYTDIQAVCTELRSIVRASLLRDNQQVATSVDKVVSGHKAFRRSVSEVTQSLIGRCIVDDVKGTVAFDLNEGFDKQFPVAAKRRRAVNAVVAPQGEDGKAAPFERHPKYHGSVGKCVLQMVKNPSLVKPVHLALLTMDMVDKDLTWEQHSKAQDTKRDKVLRTKEILKDIKALEKLVKEKKVLSSEAYSAEEVSQFNGQSVGDRITMPYVRTSGGLSLLNVYMARRPGPSLTKDAIQHVGDMHDAMLFGYTDVAFGNLVMFMSIANRLAGEHRAALFVAYGLTVARACLTLAKGLRKSHLALTYAKACIPPAPKYSVQTLKEYFFKVINDASVVTHYEDCLKLHQAQALSRRILVPDEPLESFVHPAAEQKKRRAAANVGLDRDAVKQIAAWIKLEHLNVHSAPRYGCVDLFALVSAFLHSNRDRRDRVANDAEMTRRFYTAIGEKDRVVSEKERLFPFNEFPLDTELRTDTVIPSKHEYAVAIGNLWLKNDGSVTRILSAK
jgi:hypothetical protein